MAIVKSYSYDKGDVRGDMHYIIHGNNHFTLIDCFLPSEDPKRNEEIIREIAEAAKGKQVNRFILTHTDKDHYQGIENLKKYWDPDNVYAIPNKGLDSKDDTSSLMVKEMINSPQIKKIKKDLSLRYLNQSDTDIGAAGLFFMWPELENDKFKTELKKADKGGSPNNLSPAILYRLQLDEDSKIEVKFMWLGDMETDMQTEFYKCCQTAIKELGGVDVLFAPHHGRDSGKVPDDLMEALNPKIIVIGNAPAENINYGNSDKTITRNSSGNIVFSAEGDGIHIYTEREVKKIPSVLKKMKKENDVLPQFKNYSYIGSLNC